MNIRFGERAGRIERVVNGKCVISARVVCASSSLFPVLDFQLLSRSALDPGQFRLGQPDFLTNVKVPDKWVAEINLEFVGTGSGIYSVTLFIKEKTE